jgi:hypothetical protein
MADLFASAKAVFRRAQKHVEDLNVTINEFGPDKPYRLVVEDDPHFGKHILKAKFSESFSEDISCIMFDAVNNLRSSLDQAAYAIATKHRGDSDRYAYFPFASDAVHWPNRINGAKNDFPPEIIAVFERFKPYKGGNDTLWSLHYLVNTKKHALLIPAGFGVAVSVKVGDASFRPEFLSVPKERYRKDEVILFEAPDPNAIPQIEFRYSIVIDNPEPIVEGKSPVALLNSIRREVGMVLFDLEEGCRAVGFM